jgi:NADH dehydrogenase [ubiquinone] 1 alpha subcomplex assembly factor 1
MARSTGSPPVRPSARWSRLAERLIEFDQDEDFAAWRAIDDVVMGGVSRSTLQRHAPGIASFSGIVSLDRGRGFASVRSQPRAWTTAVIPVAAFAASFCGRAVPGAQPLEPAQIRQLGLMIGDKQPGPFELLIDWIGMARKQGTLTYPRSCLR